LSTESALDKLISTNLKFLGIKENLLITDLFPMEGTSVSGSFSFAGISLNPKNEITLLFGNGDDAILERRVTLDAALQNTNEVNIEKLWAQKKIANLELQYEKNASDIELLGKKYGIITKNTSLIVLEDLRDYISYDIIPPAELRAEFDRIKKQEQDCRLAQQKNNWDNVDSYFAALNSWWKEDKKYVTPKVLPKSKKKKREAYETIKSDPDAVMTVDEPVGSGPVSEIVQEDNNVYNTIAPTVSEGRERDIIEIKKSSKLEEVVVVAYAAMKKKSMETGSVQAITSESISKNSAEISSGIVTGVDINSAIETTTSQNYSITETNDFDYNNKDKKWNPDRLYLKALASAPREKQYDLYFELRKSQKRNPSFYFDVAHFFYNQGDVKKALQVISSIADLGLENHQLYKTLTYTLRQWQDYDDAVFTAKQVVKWRSHEPQSLRDYALTLEDAGKYQEAFDELVKALEVNYYGEMSGQYEGVEDIILMDLNRMITEHTGLKIGKLDQKYLDKMPVDIRIIMNWNQMDVDLDLHVIEPTGEECYYSHKTTEAGARFSKDFTQGYGPEQYLIRNAVKGKYQIKSNYFGETELTENGPATIMVEIYTTKAGKTSRTLKTIQLGKVKENEILAEIIW
jgi:tetratricopeptide (TPR) repeat protein